MDQQFAAYLADVRKRAEALLGEDHHNESAHKLARDVLQLISNFSNLQTDSVSVGADARLMKRRLEQAKSEQKNVEKKVEQMKAVALNLVVPLRKMMNDVETLERADVQAPLKAALRHITEGIIELTKISG